MGFQIFEPRNSTTMKIVPWKITVNTDKYYGNIPLRTSGVDRLRLNYDVDLDFAHLKITYTCVL